MSDAYPERPVQPYFPDDAGVVLDYLAELSGGFKNTLPMLSRDGGQ